MLLYSVSSIFCYKFSRERFQIYEASDAKKFIREATTVKTGYIAEVHLNQSLRSFSKANKIIRQGLNYLMWRNLYIYDILYINHTSCPRKHFSQLNNLHDN